MALLHILIGLISFAWSVCSDCNVNHLYFMDIQKQLISFKHYAAKHIETHFMHFTLPYSLYALYTELKYGTQLYAT
jgi:hypothetical protein